MSLNDEAITQEKSLTDLMGELAALEDNAHNLADAPGAIRAKEREVLKAFGTAYDELKTLFEGANVEPLADAVKQKVTDQFAGEIAKVNDHITSVVEQAKQQMDEAKVDIAAAVSEFQTKLTDAQASLATHGGLLESLQSQIATISEHPALAIPPLGAAAGAPGAAATAAAEGDLADPKP